jgi:hypothetical protein
MQVILWETSVHISGHWSTLGVSISTSANSDEGNEPHKPNTSTTNDAGMQLNDSIHINPIAFQCVAQVNGRDGRC